MGKEWEMEKRERGRWEVERVLRKNMGGNDKEWEIKRKGEGGL